MGLDRTQASCNGWLLVMVRLSLAVAMREAGEVRNIFGSGGASSKGGGTW